MPTEDILPNSKEAIWARRIALFVGVYALTAWCLTVLIPKSTIDGIISYPILLPLRLAGITGQETYLSHLWAAIGNNYFDESVLIEPVAIAVILFILWRCKAFSALTNGSKAGKLLTAALLSFLLLIAVDFLTSQTMMIYSCGDQIRYLLLLSFAFVFALKANTRWWKYLLAAILGCAILHSAYALILYILGVDVFCYPGIVPRATGTLSNPNYLYPICLIGAVLTMSLIKHNDPPILKAVYCIPVMTMAAALFLTYSRAAGIGLVAGMFWLIYQERWNKQRIVVGILAMLVMAGMVLTRASTGNGDFGMDRSALGRVQIWRMSTQVIRHNWLKGVGYDSYSAVQNRYVDAKASEFNYTNFDPLNQALAMAANHGVLGVGVFILFIYAIWAACRSEKKEEHASWEWRMKQGIAAAGIALLAAGLADTPFYSIDRYPGTFMWLCCMGFLLHLEVRNNPPTSPRDSVKTSSLKRLRRTESPTGEWRYAKAFRRTSLLIIALVVLGAGSTITFSIVDAHRASKVFDARLEEARSAPDFVSIKRIPKALEECVITDEDLYFYQHPGYSLTDMHRALRVNIRAGRVKQGGSTITQQLAKNLFFSHDRTIRRKVAEIIMAVKLEKALSKEEILETYLNNINYGLGSQGIGEAAQAYFGKDTSKLTDAECALLAGLIPSPPKEITPERARSAIHTTLIRLKYANPGMYLSVKDELDQTGEDAWLRDRISPAN